jgi:flagellum-specific ATP synthase
LPRGSITGFFTVLVEGDDFSEPICDAVRAILDGHIVLSRQLAAANHYPAIDILQSVSRLQSQLASAEHGAGARAVRQALALYHQAEDLIQLGAYVAGSNPPLDAAIRARPQILEFLRQASDVESTREETLGRLTKITAALA